MPNLGFPEILMILVVALVVFGPRKLPELGKSLGAGLREFRRSTQGLKEEFDGIMKEPGATTQTAVQTAPQTIVNPAPVTVISAQPQVVRAQDAVAVSQPVQAAMAEPETVSVQAATPQPVAVPEKHEA